MSDFTRTISLTGATLSELTVVDDFISMMMHDSDRLVMPSCSMGYTHELFGQRTDVSYIAAIATLITYRLALASGDDFFVYTKRPSSSMFGSEAVTYSPEEIIPLAQIAITMCNLSGIAKADFNKMVAAVIYGVEQLVNVAVSGDIEQEMFLEVTCPRQSQMSDPFMSYVKLDILKWLENEPHEEVEEAQEDTNNFTPYGFTDPNWPGLGKVMEECGELTQVCAKIIGADGQTIYPWTGRDYGKDLVEELGDVMAIVNWFVARCPNVDTEAVLRRCQEKMEKYDKWAKERDDGKRSV